LTEIAASAAEFLNSEFGLRTLTTPTQAALKYFNALIVAPWNGCDLNRTKKSSTGNGAAV